MKKAIQKVGFGLAALASVAGASAAQAAQNDPVGYCSGVAVQSQAGAPASLEQQKGGIKATASNGSLTYAITTDQSGGGAGSINFIRFDQDGETASVRQADLQSHTSLRGLDRVGHRLDNDTTKALSENNIPSYEVASMHGAFAACMQDQITNAPAAVAPDQGPTLKGGIDPSPKDYKAVEAAENVRTTGLRSIKTPTSHL